MNELGLFTDWWAGWRRCYPPSTYRGNSARLAGEWRISKALACVDDRGRRLRPWPKYPATMLPRGVREAAEQAAQAAAVAERRAVWGAS